MIRSILSLALLLGISSTSSASSAAGTETLIGIVGADFVLLGADSSMSQSIVVTASNLDKISVIVEPTAITACDNGGPQTDHDHDHANQYRQQTIAAAAAGDSADADRLLSMLKASATMAEYEASVGCDVQFIDCNSKDETPIHDMASIASIPTLPGLSVDQVARLARSQISSRLRSATPLRVCMLVAGLERVSHRALPSNILVPSTLLPFASEQVQKQVSSAMNGSGGGIRVMNEPLDDETHVIDQATAKDATSTLRPRLYWLDEYGSIQSLLYGAHGHGSHFCHSILDRNYRADMTRDQAVTLMRECFAQLRTRYVINAPQPPCIKCIDANGCRIVE